MKQPIARIVTLKLYANMLFLLLVVSNIPKAATAVEERQIRYVRTNGSDIPQCLESKITPNEACKNIYYALRAEQDPISHMELIISPGTYYVTDNLTHPNQPLFVNDSTHFVLRGEGEGNIVLRCRNSLDEKGKYNNLAFLRGGTVEIVGVTVENCGAVPAGIYIELVEEIKISNCTFR